MNHAAVAIFSGPSGAAKTGNLEDRDVIFLHIYIYYILYQRFPICGVWKPRGLKLFTECLWPNSLYIKLMPFIQLPNIKGVALLGHEGPWQTPRFPGIHDKVFGSRCSTSL